MSTFVGADLQNAGVRQLGIAVSLAPIGGAVRNFVRVVALRRGPIQVTGVDAPFIATRMSGMNSMSLLADPPVQANHFPINPHGGITIRPTSERPVDASQIGCRKSLEGKRIGFFVRCFHSLGLTVAGWRFWASRRNQAQLSTPALRLSGIHFTRPTGTMSLHCPISARK